MSAAPANYLNVETTLRSWLLTTDHKRIGILYLVTVLAALALGGAFAMLIRIEHLTPGRTIVDPETYNQLFTLHGIVMVWLFMIPSIPSVFGNFLLPIMVGAKDVAFPRLNLLSYYIFLLGSIVTIAAMAAGGADTGWTFYAPLASTSRTAVVPVAIGIFIIGWSTILTGVNFLVTVHTMRTKGLSWGKLPIFVCEARGDDFILYGRAAAPGTQRWVGQFAGDHASNFDGLEAVLKGALNLCACGFSTWGSDLGGYFGLPEPAVYMRWTQLACFSPLMRAHGKAPREPWYFGDEAVANYKRHAWVRENLLDYVYDSAVVAHERGIPIMRSLAVAFPEEPSLAPVADEYVFGRDLLVAPVLREGNSRTIRFPSGEWTGLWDGKTVSGPTDLSVEAPLNVIPVYLRQGAVVPVRLDRQLQFGGSMTAAGQTGAATRLADGIGALVVTPPDGSESVHPLNAAGEKATVAARTTGRGFSWTLENLPEADYLLVYGRAAATTVTVDGEVLPRVMPAGFDSMPAGWVADPAGNRLVIRLPSGARGSGASRTIEVRIS